MSPMSLTPGQCSLACPSRACRAPSFSSRFPFPDDLLSHESFHQVTYVPYLRPSPNAHCPGPLGYTKVIIIILIIIIENMNPAQRVYGPRPSASQGESPHAESYQEDRSYAGKADPLKVASSSPDRRCRRKKVRENGRDHPGGWWTRRHLKRILMTLKQENRWTR